MRDLTILTTLLVLTPAAAAAQWHVGLEIGASRFWGTAREADQTADRRTLNPYRPTVFTLRVERRATVQLALAVYTAGAGLALEGDDGVAVIKDAFTVVGFAPEVGTRLLRLRGTTFHAAVGPLIELWKVDGADTRTRAGLHAALALGVPLGPRIEAAMRAGIAVIPTSVLGRDDLPPTFEPRATWRRSASAGLRWRL